MDGRLILHCGTQEVTRDDVRRIEPPEGTDSWHPISHGFLLDTTIDALGEVGLGVRNERFGLSRQDNRFFGTLDLDSQIADGVSLTLALRNSTDKSMSAGIVLGQRVFVCDNLALDAEIKVMRRHTARIVQDLPRMVEKAVGQIPGYVDSTAQRIERLRVFRLDDRSTHDIVVRAAVIVRPRCSSIPLSQYPQSSTR